MTKDEFMEKYGDVEVTFARYHKYVFTYQADLGDGYLLIVNTGGDADDVYDDMVIADWPETVRSLEPFSGSMGVGSEEIDKFSDI